MTQDMNTIYGHDLWNYGARKLRSRGEGFYHSLRFAAVLLLMVVGVNETVTNCNQFKLCAR